MRVTARIVIAAIVGVSFFVLLGYLPVLLALLLWALYFATTRTP